MAREIFSLLFLTLVFIIWGTDRLAWNCCFGLFSWDDLFDFLLFSLSIRKTVDRVEFWRYTSFSPFSAEDLPFLTPRPD